MTAPAQGDTVAGAPVRSLAAAIATISVTGFSLAMTYPLFAILLERMGASGVEIGMNAAAPAVALLLVSPLLPPLLNRASLPLLLTCGSVLLCAAFLSFRLFEDVWSWTAIRFVMGVAGTIAFWGSELWIISVAPAERRGFLIGVYGVCLSLGFMLGPLILQWIPIDGWAPFLIGAVLALAAILPVAWAWSEAPDGLGGERRSIFGALEYFRTDPTVLFAVTLFGAVEFGGFSLLPVWAVNVGLSESVAIAAVAWIAFGNVLLQLPIGWAADRFDRKMLLAICAGAIVIGPAALAALPESGWPLYAALTAMGGLAVGLYTVSLAELGDRYEGEALARGAGAFMSGYGFGALVAPPLFGWAMDLWPPHGALAAMGACAAAYLMLMAARAERRRRGNA